MPGCSTLPGSRISGVWETEDEDAEEVDLCDLVGLKPALRPQLLKKKRETQNADRFQPNC
jgi:hypothetical protein